MENEVIKRLHLKSFYYNTEKYPFKEVLESLFGFACEDAHKYLGNFEIFKRENDQSTMMHKVFYKNFHSTILPIYQDFMKSVILPIIKEEFYYQVIPTFRLGLPGNKFLGEYHKDTKYKHLSYEVNFNLGICNYVGNAALQVEESPGSKNFITLECPYGSIFSFDHIDCLHGCNISDQNATMVSFDFRLALKRLYYDSDAKSVNRLSEFKPGSYFSKSYLKS